MPGEGPELTDILRRYGDAYRPQHSASLSSAQRGAISHRTLPHRSVGRPCRAVRRLRQPAHRLQFVPQLEPPQMPGAGPRAQWLADRQVELLDTPYFHVMFTLPDAIATIAFQNPGESGERIIR